MAKLLKITGKFIGITLEWSLIIIILFAFAIRTSSFQTFLAKKAAGYLSSELNTTVQVDEVCILFFDELSLDGFLILDLDKDTLVSAEHLYVTIDDFGWKGDYFHIHEIELENARAHVKKTTAGVTNLQFLNDYFKSDKPPKKKPFHLDVKTIKLSDVHFRYDDAGTSPLDSGMDYFHIDARNVNAEITEIDLNKEHVSGRISSFSVDEKSGLKIESLQSDIYVCPDSLSLNTLSIKTSRSLIESPHFALRMSDYTDYRTFVDSVTFDGTISRSHISMADVAYFAHPLEGMNEVISFNGKISQKIPNLKISDLRLQLREKTMIKGTVQLPDFRDIPRSSLHEHLEHVYVDLEELKAVKMPNQMKDEYLSFDPYLNRLGHFEGKNICIDGPIKKLVVSADHLMTDLGGIRMDHGLLFNYIDERESLVFTHAHPAEYDINVEQFDLGAFIANGDFGKVDGVFSLTGEAYSNGDIQFSSFTGKANRFDYLGYSYSNIEITEGEFINDRFDGDIMVWDQFLELSCDGFFDLKTDHLNFELDISKASLNGLGFNSQESDLRCSKLLVDFTGLDINRMFGSLTIDSFYYTENGREIQIPQSSIYITRGETADEFKLVSNLGTGEIIGKLDFSHLAGDLNYQFSRILPNLFKENVEQIRNHIEDHFTYDFTVNDMGDFLAIFAPNLEVSAGTHLHGEYAGESSQLTIGGTSDSIVYHDIMFRDITITQIMDSNSTSAVYHVAELKYNDSLSFSDFYFKGSGGGNDLSSTITWKEHDGGNPSLIHWDTHIKDINHYDFSLDPSHFFIQDHEWHIVNQSLVNVEHDTVTVTNFQLKRGKQFIKVDGKVSNQNKHQLNFEINDLEIAELASFFTDEVEVTGLLNAWGYISNPAKNLDYLGDVHIRNLRLNDEQVGDIFAQSQWNEVLKSIDLSGDLIYKDNPSFDFNGHYYTKLEEENLEVSLLFDQTDIRFTNAFMDPDVLNDIHGNINGTLRVSGTPDHPELNGTLKLNGGGAQVAMLGAGFGFDGEIQVDKYGFYINKMPVFDREGNAGSLIGSVYHDNFQNFNFDLQFDLEEDAINRDPTRPWVPLPLDRFLVMNSGYEPGAAYYGKGYITGVANIFGYTDNLEISVTAKTRHGSSINFPMYGHGDISTDYPWIIWDSTGTNTSPKEPKIDLTGVKLNLSVDVTPEADIRIIFEEDIGDIIYANGSGTMEIGVDNLGDIALYGTYTVDKGKYDFYMGVQRTFFVEQGGTITWSGDPYNANIDLRTYLGLDANIAELNKNQLGNTRAHEEVRCYLNLSQTLMEPAIAFEIQAPNADETSKALIDAINSDRDELNKQFLSLIISRRFQPMTGTAQANGDAALDLLTSRINQILETISSKYKMGVDVDKDQVTGDNILALNFKRDFLNKRLIVSGSFGVESYESHDGLIGDLNVEYIINEPGTFRMNVYNESNDRTVIQEEDQGNFTQGAGLHYTEDFNDFQDFKAIQYFFDIFRKKGNKRYPRKRRRHQEAVPEETNPAPTHSP